MPSTGTEGEEWHEMKQESQAGAHKKARAWTDMVRVLVFVQDNGKRTDGLTKDVCACETDRQA